MIHADFDLAKRLEGLEAWCTGEFARTRQLIRPEADTAAVAVAGGFAFYFGAGSALSEAKGMGMAGPVSAEDLETLTRVFHDRGVPAKVMVCPLADPSLVEGLSGLGYRAMGFENVLYRELDRSETFPAPPEGIALDWAGPDEADVCGETLARGFAAPDEPDAELWEALGMSSRVEGLASLLARVGGEPAGAANLLIRDGLAMLCGASTLPSYRNRGIQTACTHARLAFAARNGCSLAVMGALPGTTSQKNVERLGFRVAYTKLILVREPA